eukprot:TRINITY_DN1721_c0_g1_i1.p1 TRINITY_DN1721_c0_g1~~TRINITY_DN1721_c0_g1_i1.p1  ORF type:complete len:206 (-),score=30.58 TRINITY_DN1721_c0_g1_i1:1357-1974(-)
MPLYPIETMGIVDYDINTSMTVGVDAFPMIHNEQFRHRHDSILAPDSPDLREVPIVPSSRDADIPMYNPVHIDDWSPGFNGSEYINDPLKLETPQAWKFQPPSPKIFPHAPVKETPEPLVLHINNTPVRSYSSQELGSNQHVSSKKRRLQEVESFPIIQQVQRSQSSPQLGVIKKIKPIIEGPIEILDNTGNSHLNVRMVVNIFN